MLWFQTQSVTSSPSNVKLQKSQGFTKVCYLDVSFQLFWPPYPWVFFILRYEIPELCDISLIMEKKITPEIPSKERIRNIKADK